METLRTPARSHRVGIREGEWWEDLRGRYDHTEPGRDFSELTGEEDRGRGLTRPAPVRIDRPGDRIEAGERSRSV
jgi:hypothetical protein